MPTIYSNGLSPAIVPITVPLLSKIAMFTRGTGQYALGNSTNPNVPPVWGTWINFTGQLILGTFTVAQAIQIQAPSGTTVIYNIGTAPVAKNLGSQVAAAALTVSAVLTSSQMWQGLLSANQAAAGAAAYQLPLATDLDIFLPDSVANDSFDFSLINVSTVAAEDASITTNTGWTLVGNMDVASNAAATDKSVGMFRARKTAAGAWTLYRLA